MAVCKKCKSTDIKSRRNYSHGRKSTSITTLTCRKCGSAEIETMSNDKRRRFKRR